MAENYDLIFGQSASSQYAWSDSDYQNGWETVGSTPPTAEQFDALQRRNDTKAKDLNDRLSPLETKATADGRQAATEYEEGDMVTADGLPNGWLLECVVPGTTGAGALVIPSPLVIGGTITDGTVTWKMLNLALSGVPVGYVTPFLQSTAPDGWLSCAGAEVSRAAYPDLWNFVNGSSQLISESDWQAKNTAGNINIGWFSSGDGTTTFRLPRIVGSGELTEVKRFTTAGAGSFTAPITGIYKITLQGAGGGGASAFSDSYRGLTSGGGGGQGGNIVFYEKLTAGTTYSYTVGAGGAGGTSGSQSASVGGNGGDSSITINSNAYVAGGGAGGLSSSWGAQGGAGGAATINGTTFAKGASGSAGAGAGIGGSAGSAVTIVGGNGGGLGGAKGITGSGAAGVYGGGGSGGATYNGNNPGGAGGDGYIEFSYNPVPQFWYVRAFGSATNQGTVDITALANALNAKLSISSVPLIAGYNGKQTFTSSGSFTAPITGLYKVTLQGAGGGGGGSSVGYPGCGGGSGANLTAYVMLVADQSYAYAVGAGGSGGAGNTNGTNGGTTSITVDEIAYEATGGSGGSKGGNGNYGGVPVAAKINNVVVGYSFNGSPGGNKTGGIEGGNGGGNGGGVGRGGIAGISGTFGGGGAGGGCNTGDNALFAGGAGGDGYIIFEWLDTSQL